MTELLTPEGYEQTREKLGELQLRLSHIEQRSDLAPLHLASVRRSYHAIIRELLQDMRLFEVHHAKPRDAADVCAVSNT